MKVFLVKLLLGFGLILLVKCELEIVIPTSETIYESQRASLLPMTLVCPSVAYKYIEIRGVTFVNDTNVIVASSRFPNIESVTREECSASLQQPTNKRARCEVSMSAFTFDSETELMDKVVTYDCRKTIGGDSSGEIKTISKKKGTMNIKCSDKEAVPRIRDITLASGKPVNIMDVSWKCNEENVNNMGKGKGGGHCQVHRDGYLNDSQMTVKYKCSNPPKRNGDDFVREKGKKNGKENSI